VVDGIQVATGCTLGKGNIAVRDLNEVSSTFHTKCRTIRVKTKTDVIQSLKSELLHGGTEKMEKVARRISSMPDTKLFSVEEL
jgi:formylmethanofuran dehydrogenase subunit E